MFLCDVHILLLFCIWEYYYCSYCVDSFCCDLSNVVTKDSLGTLYTASEHEFETFLRTMNVSQVSICQTELNEK